MTLPAVVVGAGRAIGPRVATWVSTAEIGAIQKLKSFLASHPAIASTFASVGITGVVDSAINGDPSSIQALNDFADSVGIGDVTQGIKDAAVRVVNKGAELVLGDDDDIVVEEDEVRKAQMAREMCIFIRENFSSNPQRVLAYHRQFREFIEMSPDSLNNLMRAYM